MAGSDKHIKVACCFCGEGVTSSLTDPCSINVLINWDKSRDKQYSQDFYCHLVCFKKQIIPTIPLYIEYLGCEEDDQE
jgi:hypothetical protein